MSYNFLNLDADTREYMLAELAQDIDAHRVYSSPRLSANGHAAYTALLEDAFASGNPDTLASGLSAPGLFNSTETTNAGVVRKMASNAPSLLAGGEFNRYYMRAVAARALAGGQPHVTVYRARESGWHRPESDAQIGQNLDAEQLLEHLRANTLTPDAITMPDVNSGLSVHL